MSAVLPGLRSPFGRWLRLGAWLGAAVLVGALAWTASEGMTGEERARLIRYVGILIAAGLAIGAPHALYPDPHAVALQLSNPAPRWLLRHQLSRWLPIVLLLTVPALVIALSAPAPRWGLAAEGTLGVLGLGLYALARSAPLGRRVRAWEREEAGAGYRRMKARVAEVSMAPPLAVPDALVPGLLLTGEVFLAGGALAIAGEQFGGGLAASGMLLALAVGLLARQIGAFDRAFWTTHGVWADAFRAAAGPASGREALAYGSVYWAPQALRPSVWAGLVSLDRRFPLGRVAVVLLALVVGVVAAGQGAGVQTAALALYVLVVNGAVALTAAEAVVPGALAVRFGGVARWTAARFLMNVRWVPPLALTLALLAWTTEAVGVEDIAVWSLVDVAAAALTALFVSSLAHVRTRRAVA